MTSDDLPARPAPPSAQVQVALALIEGSAAFRAARRHRTLLRHLVERVLADDAAALKESVIALEVFGRAAAQFDPRRDSIVRVEARRLRARLARYYAGEGKGLPWRLELPVGSYVPQWVERGGHAAAADATRHARDLVERGEHFLRQAASHEAMHLALARFDAALRESPDYAPALVGMGRAWFNLAASWGADPAVAADHAAEALRRALRLDPTNAMAHTLLAAIAHQFEHDWPAAQRGFERACRLAPHLGFVHSAYGFHLILHGDSAAAERSLMLARELDPHYLNTRMHLVSLRLAQRRFADALAELDALGDVGGPSMPTVGTRALIALVQGDADAAVAGYRQACALALDHPGCPILLAAALASGGVQHEADALVAQTLARFDARRVSPYALAIFETYSGRHEAAFALLARAIAERDPYAMHIGNDPVLTPLHADPRWRDFALTPNRRPSMHLIGMLDSPYVRRVAIALQLLGLRFQHTPLSVFRTFDQFRALNPVVKAPTLVADDGTVLMDSTLILQYAQALAPQRPLLPAQPAALLHELQVVGLALALAEKSVQVYYEQGLRPADKQHAPWTARVSGQLAAAAQGLEHALAARPLDTRTGAIGLGAVSSAVAWTFVQAVTPTLATPAQCPQLAALTARCEALPEFRAAPYGDGTVTPPPSS